MPVSNKAAVWRGRLGRHQRSGLTVAEFCEREGVSVPSFYQWKRRLAQPIRSLGKPPAASRQQVSGPAFQQLTLVSSPEVVTIEWTSGLRMELPAANLPLVRAVVAELLRAEHARSEGDGQC